MTKIDAEYIILCEGENEKLFLEDLFKRQDTFDGKKVESILLKIINPSKGIKNIIVAYYRSFATVYFMLDYDDKKVIKEIDSITRGVKGLSNFKLIVQRPNIEVYEASWFSKVTLDATWDDRKLTSKSNQFLNNLDFDLHKKWTITEILKHKGDINLTKRLEGKFDIAKYIK